MRPDGDVEPGMPESSNSRARRLYISICPQTLMTTSRKPHSLRCDLALNPSPRLRPPGVQSPPQEQHPSSSQGPLPRVEHILKRDNRNAVKSADVCLAWAGSCTETYIWREESPLMWYHRLLTRQCQVGGGRSNNTPGVGPAAREISNNHSSLRRRPF